MYESSSIIQNLIDAGCDEPLIKKYKDLQAEGKTDEQLRILACYRYDLLDHLHKQQKQVDCLDYLIYTIKKNINDQCAEKVRLVKKAIIKGNHDE